MASTLQTSPPHVGTPELPDLEPDLASVVSLDDVFEHYKDKFSPGQIRWALRHRDSNGLAKYVLRVGRRIYLDVRGFELWVFAQRIPEDRSARGG